ncbi:MAG: Mut7-C RNAse domain-containing protein, partial [Bacteroidetes bacterium]|nr:Mut7-C RNAse domain-containing protein [Bacteroidota bacterium]
NELDDHQIIVIAEKEKRIVLSRDIGLLKNGNLSRGYWLRSQDPREQIIEVIQRLDLREQILPFHRCMECNGEIDRVKKESVIDLLEPMTREHFDDFYQCRGCKKIYWQGSHYEKMLEMILRLKGK